MTNDSDLAAWQANLAAVEDAQTVWLVQLGTRWFTEPEWERLRDRLDLALFRSALRDRHPCDFKRLLLYDPPSDVGGHPGHYRRAKEEHERWLSRVRRQLAALGAPSSAGGALAGRCDYRARLVILPRAGQPPAIALGDGIWMDTELPPDVTAMWNAEGLIPLDPHEENIVGPYADRNPLWAGSRT
jgi:hypothetical protein